MGGGEGAGGGVGRAGPCALSSGHGGPVCGVFAWAGLASQRHGSHLEED